MISDVTGGDTGTCIESHVNLSPLLACENVLTGRVEPYTGIGTAAGWHTVNIYVSDDCMEDTVFLGKAHGGAEAFWGIVQTKGFLRPCRERKQAQ